MSLPTNTTINLEHSETALTNCLRTLSEHGDSPRCRLWCKQFLKAQLRQRSALDMLRRVLNLAINYRGKLRTASENLKDTLINIKNIQELLITTLQEAEKFLFHAQNSQNSAFMQTLKAKIEDIDDSHELNTCILHRNEKERDILIKKCSSIRIKELRAEKKVLKATLKLEKNLENFKKTFEGTHQA
jgi:hypothetical protein